MATRWWGSHAGTRPPGGASRTGIGARYPSLDPESAAYRPDLLQAGWVLQILPGQEYVPPIDDGESGEEVTPAPSADEEYETDSPAPG